MEVFREHLIRNIVITVLLIALALVSCFGLAPYYSDPDNRAEAITDLDQKKETVLELTAASVAVSTAISFLPGDDATPIADKLADLSTYFLAVLCAIFLEKYLLTITAWVSLKLLVPAVCLFGIVFLLNGRQSMHKIAQKMAVFAIVLVFVVPASLWISNMIEDTYQTSIASTIEIANDTSAVLEESNQQSEETDANILQKLINKVKNKVGEKVNTVSEYIRNMVNRFLEALAVLLVTSCLIPIAVLMFMVWFLKSFLSIDLPVEKNRYRLRGDCSDDD